MLNHLKNATNIAYTENGARAHKTTLNSLLDMFSQAGAWRTRSVNDKVQGFTKALGEDALLAMKMLFYFRDVRGGQGERKTFTDILHWLAVNHPQFVEKNIHLIAEYGRWDDLYALYDTPLEKVANQLFKDQLTKDLTSENPSVLAKWLKSENASAPETIRLAIKTRKALGMSSQKYRTTLSGLRKRLKIVETPVSQKKYDEIEYDKIPSYAGMKYKNAFSRNDADRYVSFLQSVEKGEKKINAGTLFPYDIVGKVMKNTIGWNKGYQNDPTLNAMWEALPNYIGDKKENSIAVVDVSGSMSGLPMQVAISLGLYMAERNKGQFHNHYITFSSMPTLQQVTGKTLCEKIWNMERTDVGYDTNVHSVFKLILNTAIKNKVPQSEMIDKIYMISDMEFNSSCIEGTSKTLFQAIRDEFELAGYTMPKLCFWNVNARNTQFPMTMNDLGVQLVSGASPSIFTNLMTGKEAYDLMLDVLNGERYSKVTV